MEAKRNAADHRDGRAKRLAAVVAVQSALVAACLFISVYAYWDAQKQVSGDHVHVHIRFGAVSDILVNETVEFHHIISHNKVSLASANKSRISISCTGPYVLHMNVCYKDIDGKQTNGTLELKVVGRKTPLSSFMLQAMQATHVVCRGLHSIVYLRWKEEATLSLFSVYDGFKIRNVTVGLGYLLGSQCQY